MSCVYCGGKLAARKVVFYHEEAGERLFIRNVPARVCVQCGEKTFSPKITDEILKLAGSGTKPVDTIKIPVFDYAVKS